MIRTRLLAVAAALAAAGSAPAGFTATYNSAAAFATAFPAATIETFSFAAVVVDENTPVTRNGITYSVTGSSAFDDLEVGGGNLDYGVGNGAYASILLTFSAPVFALGADFVGAATLGGTTLTTGAGDALVLTTVQPAPGTGFVGFATNAPFTTLRLTSTSGSLELASLDNLRFAAVAAVPAPPAVALALMGLASFGGIARLRRRAAA